MAEKKCYQQLTARSCLELNDLPLNNGDEGNKNAELDKNNLGLLFVGNYRGRFLLSHITHSHDRLKKIHFSEIFARIWALQLRY